MKILLINNYFHIVGGAEVYFFNLAELLKQKGHEVIFFSMKHPNNLPTEFDKYFVDYLPPLQELSFRKKIIALGRIFYSFEAKKKIRQLIKEQKPDIVHINSIWYEITHSIIFEIKKFGIPIAMTLHDYRMICPNHKLLSGNKTCFSCRQQKYYMTIFKKCFKGSFLKNFIATLIQYFNNWFLRTYKLIDLFISPSQFLIKTLEESSLFRNISIEYLPYCIDVDKYESNFNTTENSIIYFGRLDYEKGVDILIDAVEGLDITLKIVGTGPLEYCLRKKVKDENIGNVYFKGFMSHQGIKEEVSKSLFSVLPSIWYENYPYSAMESFALGKPVVGSDIGGIPELIKNGVTGITFTPRDIRDLREKIQYLLLNKELIYKMGNNARNWAKENLDCNTHYDILLKRYAEALGSDNVSGRIRMGKE